MGQFQADWARTLPAAHSSRAGQDIMALKGCTPVQPREHGLFGPSTPTNNFACNSLEYPSNLEIQSLIFCGFRPYSDSHRRGIACGISGMTLGGAPSTTATYAPLPPTSTARPRPHCHTQAAQPAMYLAASHDSRCRRSPSGARVLDRK